MSDRLKGLRQRLQHEGVDALVVSQADNRRYLSGFTGSAGFLVLSESSAVLATDFRYIQQARHQSPGFEVFRSTGELPKCLPEIVASLGVKRVGIESDVVSYATYQRLIAGAHQCQIIPTEGIVESLRADKSDEELELIAKAVEISDGAFEEVLPTLRSGMSERQAAWELERSMRERGSESLPFDVIVASGPNSALPHHQPSERIMRDGEPVVVDMGACVGGYSSDLSRTICLGGGGDDRFGKIYDLVLGAQLTAMATIEAGMSGEQADNLARVVIDEGGYAEEFGHGLGHGIGLAPHELPRLGRGSGDVLEDGMVFTIEPGIYIEGWGGVRLEDVVVLEEGRVKVLSKAGKVDS